MSIDNLYYPLNEVATKLNITVQKLLHLGSIGKVEIVASIAKDITPTAHEVRNYTEQQINEVKKFSGIDCVQQREEWSPVVHVCHFFVCDFDMLREFEIERCKVAHTSSCRHVYVLHEPDRTYSKMSYVDYKSDIEMFSPIKIVGYWFQFQWFDIETESHVDCETIGVDIDDLYIMHEELDRFIKAQTEPTPETKEPKELNPTERQSLHTIIKTLANFIIDPSAKPEKEKSDNERGKPPFKNQTQLIEFLSDKEQGMGEVRGFSKANLEKVFSKNNKSE